MIDELSRPEEHSSSQKQFFGGLGALALGSSIESFGTVIQNPYVTLGGFALAMVGIGNVLWSAFKGRQRT